MSSLPLLNQNAFASVGPPQSWARTPFGPYVPFAFIPARTPRACMTPDEGSVERDVDGAGAADDLAVVVDRLATGCRELLLDRDRRAGVERGDDADLRTGRDALLGLRKLLLRVVQRVHDRRLDARLLEPVDERRLVELLPPDRRLRVRQEGRTPSPSEPCARSRRSRRRRRQRRPRQLRRGAPRTS